MVHMGGLLGGQFSEKEAYPRTPGVLHNQSSVRGYYWRYIYHISVACNVKSLIQGFAYRNEMK
jgi:hypothetical protein